MAFGVPGFFGNKVALSRPLAVDVTTITEVSFLMRSYAEFITNPALYEALETSLQAESIGTLDIPNRYSFVQAAVYNGNEDDPNDIDAGVQVNGNEQMWADGGDVLAQNVVYPVNTLTWFYLNDERPDIGKSTNIVSDNDREYDPISQRIIIAAATQSGRFWSPVDPPFAYPQRVVGIFRFGNIRVIETPGLPPAPAGTLVGYVYTTSAEGVAIYFNGSTVNYREKMPVSSFNNLDSPHLNAKRFFNLCKSSNGAVYNIDALTTFESYALLGESLGSVLGKYLYSVS